MSEYSENYSLNFDRIEDGGCSHISMHFSHEFLPEVLNKMREFLNAAGFTYVNALVAYSNNGEHSSEDI